MTRAVRRGVVTEVRQGDNPAEYIRLYRERSPDYVERSNARQAARARALTALARRYPDDYDRLLRRELRKAGLV